MDKPSYKWTYAECKANGVCPSCRSKTPVPGKALCKECRENRALPHNKARQKKMVQALASRYHEKGMCRCGRPSLPGVKICQSCSDKAKVARDKIRDNILVHYGDKCACCGEHRREFLTIDHINNDGHRERKKLDCRGYSGGFYHSIIKRGFPDHYQILCWNCNCAKGRYGQCPHEKERNNV